MEWTCGGGGCIIWWLWLQGCMCPADKSDCILPCNWRLIMAVMLPDSSPRFTTSRGFVSLSSDRLATQWPFPIPERDSFTWGPIRGGHTRYYAGRGKVYGC